MLETLGKCPLEFFLKYVLGVEHPNEYIFDPAKWLDPLNKGSLLHSVFYEFMTELNKSGAAPNFKNHEKHIYQILEKYISHYQSEFIPPGRDIFEKEKRELAKRRSWAWTRRGSRARSAGIENSSTAWMMRETATMSKKFDLVKGRSKTRRAQRNLVKIKIFFRLKISV